MKFEELITNEEFNLQVSAARNAQEIVDLFAAKDVEIPMELAQELFEKPATDAELSADDLDDVAGGGFIKGTARLIVSCGVAFGYGALCGICPAAYAGAPYVAGGLTAWTTAGYLSNKKKK